MHGFWVSMGLAAGVALAAGLPLAWVAARWIRPPDLIGALPALLVLAQLTLTGSSILYCGPLLVMATAGIAFQRILHEYGDAARSLGASEWRLFFRVVLPLGWASVLRGVVYAWALVGLFVVEWKL